VRVRRRHVIAGLTAAAMAPVMLVVGGVLFTEGGSAPATTGAAQVVQGGADTAGSADLSTSVSTLQVRLQRLPGDWTAWASLGSAYLGQARVTADPTFYDKADEAFARSLQVQPQANADALAGQAALANARHDFEGGRGLAEQAVAADAYDATAYGVLSDAHLELGDYEAGEAALERMLELRPGVAAFSRASYLFELRGEQEPAREAMQKALDVASLPADAGFASYHLGLLALSSGDLDGAQQHFDDARQLDPAATEALAGNARVLAARGDVDAAVTAWDAVVTRLPQATYLVEYGDYLHSLGRAEEAAAQYAVADAYGVLAEDSGVISDVEVVLYDADQGRAEQALAGAEAQYAVRRSIHVEDAYAWALHVNGRDEEALVHAVAAQQTGFRSASFAFHRGMIEKSLGLHDQARASLQEALAINPHFSPLHAETAQAALDELGTTG